MTSSSFWPRGIRLLQGLAQDFWADGTPAISGLVAATGKTARDLSWHGDALEIRQRIWGEEQPWPGEHEFFAALAALPLGGGQAALDLTAGLGWLARQLALKLAAQVTALETDVEAATRGMELSVRAGKSREAAVAHYQPEGFVSDRTYDVLLARTLFSRFADQAQLVLRMAAWVKPGGQAVFTDYVLDAPGQLAVQGWLEQSGARPLPLADIVQAWAAAGFDVRVTDDETDAYRQQIVQGLAGFVRQLKERKPDGATGRLIMAELEQYARLEAALRNGLRYYRFRAVKVNN